MFDSYSHQLTAGELKAILMDVSDDTPVMIQHLDTESLMAGFPLKSLTFEIIDRHDVDPEVAFYTGIGKEEMMADYLSAASVHLNNQDKCLLINFNEKL